MGPGYGPFPWALAYFYGALDYFIGPWTISIGTEPFLWALCHFLGPLAISMGPGPFPCALDTIQGPWAITMVPGTFLWALVLSSWKSAQIYYSLLIFLPAVLTVIISPSPLLQVTSGLNSAAEFHILPQKKCKNQTPDLRKSRKLGIFWHFQCLYSFMTCLNPIGRKCSHNV